MEVSCDVVGERVEPAVLLALQPQESLVHVPLLVVHLSELCFVPAGRLLHAFLERLVVREDDLP